MALDTSDISRIESKISTSLTTDQAVSIKDAMGNQIDYQRPTLHQQMEAYDWLTKRAKTRTSMFDKCRFSSRE
jgi:hypothetical protein